MGKRYTVHFSPVNISFVKPGLSHLDGFESFITYQNKKRRLYLLQNVVMTGLDYHFRFAKMYGVKSVKPDFSDSPPDCRI